MTTTTHECWFSVAATLLLVAGLNPTEGRSSGMLDTVVFDEISAGEAGIITFGAPRLNERNLVFTGGIRLQTGERERGLWVSPLRGQPVLVAEIGQSVPGIEPEVKLSGLNDSGAVNRHGDTVVGVTLNRPGEFDSDDRAMIRVTADGVMSLIARRGTTPPGVSTDFTIDSFLYNPSTNPPWISESGHATFSAQLAGPGVNFATGIGIWAESANNGLELIAKGLDPAVGIEGEAHYSFILDLTSNSAGQLSFYSRVAGPGITIENREGIWGNAGGEGIELLARTGDLAVGTEPDVVFSDLRNPGLSDQGVTRFIAELSGPGINYANDTGLWRTTSGDDLDSVVREGDLAPGIDGNVPFDLFGTHLTNRNETMLFSARVSGGRVGLWKEEAGELSLVALSGEPAPGTEPGVSFDFSSLASPALLNPSLYRINLNDRGQVAIFGRIMGSDIDSSNNFGLWAQASDGSLQLVAREGGVLDVSDVAGQPDHRTIRQLSFVSDGINNQGQIAFAASFVDGSEGIFVSNIVAEVQGDYNRDGVVDLADYTMWRNQLGASGLEPFETADGNGDGSVTTEDYHVWKTHFGKVTTSHAEVSRIPEPSSFLLVPCVLVQALAIRRVLVRRHAA